MLELVIPTRMRAAVITAPRTLEIQEVDTPEPAPDQVLIRVYGCGVCGTNLPLWEGREWFSYPALPGSPGHEGWGVVVELGVDVEDLQLGDRVAFISERAFAEYDVAPASSVVVLPMGLEGRDVPGEPLGCAINIFRRSGIRIGQTVGIVGVGFLGALVTQLASRAGARVIAISQRLYSLELARKMGAEVALELGTDDKVLIDRVEELTGGVGCDRVIELVGLQRPLELAAKLCRVRGRLVIAGVHQDGPRLVDMFLWNWRDLDVVNAHEISTGGMAPSSLYTHRVPLERAHEVFELLRLRPDGFVKALVTP